jgi:hypothetical protein
MSGRASGTSDTTTAEPISKASSDAIEKVPGPSLSQGKGSPAQDARADQGLALLVRGGLLIWLPDGGNHE